MERKMYAYEMKEGERYEPLEFVVTQEMNRRFRYGADDYNSRYAGKKGMVHPSLLLNMSNNTKSPSFKLPEGCAEIHAKEETEFYNPVYVGEKIIINWKVVENFNKNSTPWQIVEIDIKDDKGKKIMKRVMTNTFTTINKKKGKYNIGDMFLGNPKFITQEMVEQFSGIRNIHSDMVVAKRCGLDKQYVSATQYLGHLTELMIDVFGEDWLKGGYFYQIKFIRPVTINDVLTAGVKITHIENINGKTIYYMDAWSENNSGEAVLVGNAVGTLSDKK